MDLIKRQRIKFTVITTLLGALLLLVMLGGFFVMTYVSNNVSMKVSLEKALSAPETYNELAPQGLRCFFVYVKPDGTVKIKGDLTYYGNPPPKSSDLPIYKEADGLSITSIILFARAKKPKTIRL